MSYKVLLVDDEQIYLQYMQRMIQWEQLGCHICGCAQNGIEAVEMAEDLAPDIILMDINMSHMDGLAACSHLRDRDFETKIIIMTAFDEFSFAHQAIKLNVSDYLLKPFDGEELKKALEKCISEIRKEQETESRLIKQQASANSLEDEEKQNSQFTALTQEEVNVLIKAFEMKKYDSVDKSIEKIFALSQNQMFSLQFIIATYYSLITEIYNHFNYDGHGELLNVMGTQTSMIEEIAACSTKDQMLDIVKNNVYEIFSACMDIPAGNKREVLTKKIEKYLQQHYCEQSLSVKQIADQLYFENSYIRRVFRTQTGKTIIQRLEEIRIEKAKEMLREGKYKNSEIAEKTGYCDQQYFSKRFKKVCGYTPSQYQKRTEES